MKEPNLSALAQCLKIIHYLATTADGINRFTPVAGHLICQLPTRIFELKEDGCIFTWRDEQAADEHGVVHQGIRRYFLTYAPPHILAAATAKEKAHA